MTSKLERRIDALHAQIAAEIEKAKADWDRANPNVPGFMAQIGKAMFDLLALPPEARKRSWAAASLPRRTGKATLLQAVRSSAEYVLPTGAGKATRPTAVIIDELGEGDQGMSAISDGCKAFPKCIVWMADGQLARGTPLVKKEGQWRCPSCGGSYGFVKKGE